MKKRKRFFAIPFLTPLVASMLAFAFTWLIVVPPFQGADEIGHFLYVQSIVDKKKIPWTIINSQDKSDRRSESEDYIAVTSTGLGMIAGNPQGQVPKHGLRDTQWIQRQNQIDKRQRVLYESSTFKNPPVYYLLQTPAYFLSQNQSIFTREFILRIFNILFLLAYFAATWLLAKELFQSTLARAALTSLVVLQPQVSHLATVVNPDIFFSFCATLFTFFAAKGIKVGFERKWAFGLILTSIMLAFSHIRGIAFPLIALLLLLYKWKTQSININQRKQRNFAFYGLLIVSLISATAISAEYRFNHVRALGSYLWRFYLPDLPGMSTKLGGNWDVKDAFFDRFFGTFGYLDVVLDQSLLHYISVALVLYLLILVGSIAFYRNEVLKSKELIAAMTIIVVAYILSVHFAAFRTFDTSSDPVLTGRYLLPVLPLLSAGVIGHIALLPQKYRPALHIVAVFLVITLQLTTLGAALDRYYV